MSTSHLHIWSDIPDHKLFGLIPKASTRPGAVGHAQEHDGGIVVNVTSLRHLDHVFIELAYDGKFFDEIDFHVHGSPGSISLGKERLNIKTIEPFLSKGYDQLLKAGGTVRFVGCNTGEKAIGEYFLTLAAKLFAKRNGGKVMANTGAGFGFTDDPVHPFGDWVTAECKGGGNVSLSGHRHLVLKTIKTRHLNASLKLERLRMQHEYMWCSELEGTLKKARKVFTPPADPASWYNLYVASRYLDKVERDLRIQSMPAYGP